MIDDIKDIKEKKYINKTSKNPLITEDNERINFKHNNKNNDNKKIKKAKTNCFLDEKEDINDNIINVKKYYEWKEKK